MRHLKYLILFLSFGFAWGQNVAEPKVTERKLRWDEENRLKAVSDNGFVSYYTYDHSGERVLKQSGKGEGVHVNSEFSGGSTGTGNYVLYVSPLMVVRNGSEYTKHIYAGSERVSSKMGDGSTYQGPDPRQVPRAGDGLDASVRPNWGEKIAMANVEVKAVYDSLKVPYSGDNNAPGFTICPNCSTTGKSVIGSSDVEKLMFYYHPDHLGSSSYITNLNGEVSQHMEYVPFGEVFLEERNGAYNTPYKFNAKELDEEIEG